MAKILTIETSTALCSVALCIDSKCVASRRSGLDRSHAAMTAVYCDEVLKEAGLKLGELDAVCISDGPGSYTGLRVGLSTAKGLCFGAGLKLLSVRSLDVLAEMGAELRPSAALIVPMVDARRMEVYTARYAAGETGPERISEIEALIVEEGAFSDVPQDCLFIGDGAVKCREAIGRGEFIETYPDAAAMGRLAEKEYAAQQWRDVAYCEPFYLKDFVATCSKKKLF